MAHPGPPSGGGESQHPPEQGEADELAARRATRDLEAPGVPEHDPGVESVGPSTDTLLARLSEAERRSQRLLERQARLVAEADGAARRAEQLQRRLAEAERLIREVEASGTWAASRESNPADADSPDHPSATQEETRLVRQALAEATVQIAELEGALAEARGQIALLALDTKRQRAAASTAVVHGRGSGGGTSGGGPDDAERLRHVEELQAELAEAIQRSVAAEAKAAELEALVGDLSSALPADDGFDLDERDLEIADLEGQLVVARQEQETLRAEAQAARDASSMAEGLAHDLNAELADAHEAAVASNAAMEEMAALVDREAAPSAAPETDATQSVSAERVETRRLEEQLAASNAQLTRLATEAEISTRHLRRTEREVERLRAAADEAAKTAAVAESSRVDAVAEALIPTSEFTRAAEAHDQRVHEALARLSAAVTSLNDQVASDRLERRASQREVDRRLRALAAAQGKDTRSASSPEGAEGIAIAARTLERVRAVETGLSLLVGRLERASAVGVADALAPSSSSDVEADTRVRIDRLRGQIEARRRAEMARRRARSRAVRDHAAALAAGSSRPAVRRSEPTERAVEPEPRTSSPTAGVVRRMVGSASGPGTAAGAAHTGFSPVEPAAPPVPAASD